MNETHFTTHQPTIGQTRVSRRIIESSWIGAGSAVVRIESLIRTLETNGVTDMSYGKGYDAGKAAGTWVEIDSSDTAQFILGGFENGDPEVMDLQPAPLSGEWAGESIPELSAQFGIDLEDDEVATEFENGYSEGFWAEVIRRCRYELEG